MRRSSFWRGICLWIALLAVTAGPVYAHADLIRSAPAAGERLAGPPEQIRLWFSEELDARRSEFQLFDSAGQRVEAVTGRVDLDDPDHASLIAIAPPLPQGGYVVRWQVVTIDDDGLTEGEFSFAVGDAPLPPKPPEGLAPALIWAAIGMLAVAALVIGTFAWQQYRRGKT